jgi:two-component system, OmpR family, response regulator VicR
LRVNKSILIVDDDELLAGVFQGLLKEDGHDVFCCHNGSDALELANKQSFDVIITDYNMPGIKGDELCRLLRHYHPDIFIVGCSSECQDKAFISAGADTFILKNRLIQNITLLMQSSTTY